MQRFVGQLATNTVVRDLTLIMSTFVANFFIPVLPIILVCLACVIVDMYYGMRVAVFHKSKIESRKNWKGTLMKLKNTFIILVLAHAVEKYIIGPDSPFAILTITVSLIISFTELLSIVESLHTLDPSGPWRIVGAFLRKKGETHLDVNLEPHPEKGDLKNTKKDEEHNKIN